MKRLLLTIFLLGAGFIIHAQEEDLSVNNFWTYNGDMTNALFKHISSIAFDQINARWTHVGSLKTKDEWLNRQVELKKIMAEMVGEFPDKTPLNPVITGRIKKDDFVVEKLYFESRPGFYVTAALFLPSGKKGKLPAILLCSGHHQNSFRNSTYQRNIINLVKKGFVVLAMDPVGQGERFQYLDIDRTVFGATHQHSFPGNQSYISGRTPANYFIWDGIRAIDYLISRKEVDPARIGITGQSGGGTQTAYIAAMDERIVAAAPECYITSFNKLMRSLGLGDVEQNLLYSLKNGFDQSDLIEIRAPKPTLIVATTRDIFSIQGTRDVYHEAQKAFTALGKPGNINMVEDDAFHDCTVKNREAIVAFFQKFLNNPGNSKEEEGIEIFEDNELWATTPGQVETSLKGVETIYSMNLKYTDEVLEKLQSEKQHHPDFYKDVAQKVKSFSGYEEPVLSRDYIFSGRFWRGEVSIEKYLLKGPGDYYIPVLRLSSGNNNGKSILWLDDQGKAMAAAKGGWIEKFAQNGYQVIVPDLNGFGELSGGYNNGDAYMQGVSVNIWYAGILTQKFPLAIRMEEIKIISDFIRNNEEVSRGKLIISIASGTLSTDLLHAALINNEFDRIALINPLYSYMSIVQEKNYHPKFVMSAIAGVIGKYDLPDLVTALSPLKVCMINPVNAIDQPVDQGLYEKYYSDAKMKYGASQNFLAGFNVNDVILKIEQWLEK